MSLLAGEWGGEDHERRKPFTGSKRKCKSQLGEGVRKNYKEKGAGRQHLTYFVIIDRAPFNTATYFIIHHGIRGSANPYKYNFPP